MDDSSELARPLKPTIEVASLSEEVAIVALFGEHDIATKPELCGALQTACERPRVLVDLTSCDFLDSTALAVLLSSQRKQIERGGRFEVVIPSDAHQVRRIIKLARIDALLTIHLSRSAGLASLENQPDAT